METIINNMVMNGSIEVKFNKSSSDSDMTNFVTITDLNTNESL